MDSLIHIAALSPPPNTSRPSGRTLSHFRSLSSVPTTASLADSAHSSAKPDDRPRYPTKSTSTSQLPFINRSGSIDLDDEMSTIPDPRSRGVHGASPLGSSFPSPTHHPDLSDEVATLSTKLINAINHQTVLDDTLSATRHELESAQSRIRELEAQNASQREMMAGDVWVRRSTLDAEKKALQAEKRKLQYHVEEEREKRISTEREKTKIEQELENLTAALFEEANQMVIKAKEDARHEQELVQRKSDQLRAQLVDTEGLLKSQQEQLSELKNVMEIMAAERDRDDATNNTAPSSPGLSKYDARDDERSVVDGPVLSPALAGPAPCHPTSLQHHLQPVMRTDLAAYDDFIALAGLSRHRQETRVSSGSIAGLGGLSLGLGGSSGAHHTPNGSTSSLAAVNAPSSSSAPQSPNTPQSMVSNSSTAHGLAPIPNLRDTRFYKRILAEDVEPTLRLDIAPGLSWLARRSVISAISDGTLVVEPVQVHSSLAAIAKPQFYPCSLCGETRKDPIYLRNHRFRTQENESSQRYPLCKYCLNRVRSTCDFLGFLRLVKDGHWRVDSPELEKAAWEETVRLRDQMFWARLGGGVVLTNHALSPIDASTSRRPSAEGDRGESNISDVVPDKVDGGEDHGADSSEALEPPNASSVEKPLPVPDESADSETPRTPPMQTSEAIQNAQQEATEPPAATKRLPDLTARLSLNIP